jgi:hypothetical protein
MCRSCGSTFEIRASHAARGEGVYCSPECYRNATRTTGVDEFEKYADMDGDGCWPWRGRINRSGYGILQARSHRGVRAHRFAYELFVGQIPAGLLVCHHCDVRHCVNPTHLFVGTHADNSQDMARKGRNVSNLRFGERHNRAKVTANEVRAIRAKAAAGTPTRELSEQYGINMASIRKIVLRYNWKHVA